MGDILVRGVPDEMRSVLKARARAHRRSLSEEVCELLDGAIANAENEGKKPFVSGYEAFAEIREKFALTDDEHKEWQDLMDSARKTPDRPAPEFE